MPAYTSLPGVFLLALVAGTCWILVGSVLGAPVFYMVYNGYIRIRDKGPCQGTIGSTFIYAIGALGRGAKVNQQGVLGLLVAIGPY